MRNDVFTVLGCLHACLKVHLYGVSVLCLLWFSVQIKYTLHVNIFILVIYTFLKYNACLCYSQLSDGECFLIAK